MGRKKPKPVPKRIRRSSDERCLEDSKVRLEHALAEQLMHATALAQLEAEIPRLRAIIAALEPPIPQLRAGEHHPRNVPEQPVNSIRSVIPVPDHLQRFIKPVPQPHAVLDEDLLRDVALPGDNGKDLLE